MIHKTTYSNTRNRLRHAVCALGLLISLAAMPAYGQHVHQLSYNGSTWEDEQLPSAQTTVITSIASILTTPNNQGHVRAIADLPRKQTWRLPGEWNRCCSPKPKRKEM